MYRCPIGCTDHQPAFVRDQFLSRKQYMDASGEDFSRSAPIIIERGPVRCAKCNALAEWASVVQTEMFAVEPTLGEVL